MSKKTRSTKTRITVRAGNGRHVIVISLALTLLAAGGVFAHWSNFVSSDRRQDKKSSGAVTTQSFAPGSPSKEYIYSGGRLVATEEPISSCTYSIAPTSASFTSVGGSGSVAVTAGPGCGWTASSNNSWITIDSGSSGSGNGAVGYSVAANVGGARTGTMTIAGQTFTVTQAAPGCNYSIVPTSQNFIAAGGSGSVAVTAGGGCGWTASSNNSWITIDSGSSGSGNGAVGYSVAANVGGARTGTMTIAGQTFTVTQAAPGCNYSIVPTSQNFIAAGGSGSVAVTAGGGCGWTASSNNSWITINSGSSGNGNGTVGYSVAANTGPGRTGTMTIAGQTMTITQDSGCSFGISPSSANYTTSGGSGSVTVTANQSCPWVAISNNPSWITVTSGANGTGNGTVSYSVAANTGVARSGSIGIATQSFSITQDGAAVGCQVSSFAGTGTAGYAEGSGGTSKFSAPVGVVLAKAPIAGNPDALYVADAINNRIRVVYLSSANSALIAGNGTAGYSEGSGNPLNAMYNHPKGITAIKDVNGVVTALLVADTDNQVIRKLAWSGGAWVPSLYSGKQGTPGYVDGSASASRYNQPHAISAASSSLIFVADTGNGKIRKLDQNGTSTTQSATGVSSPTGVTVNLTTTNLIYVSDQTQHKIFQVNTTTNVVTVLAGSGSAGFADGTGAGAQFNSPRQLAWTSGDVLFITDVNNFRVRKLVAGTQAVTTLAGSGAQGNANGDCASASFKGPQGIAAFGPTGEVYVVDTADNKIRKVQP